eukprot:TRINITY_DN6585_c0_g1_i1.p1 TRINITY_DN6585_c0_g1~~TRINITY_DN6585_c0_g1_i1.p1  ORF type:complete len:272 (-),score=42.00 TRINITY_DN6585_c0_g1_i1:137-892(-)
MCIRDRYMGKDLLQILLEKNSDENSRNADFMDNQEITNMFLTIFSAGMESTALLSHLALYFLHANPEWEIKVRNEISAGDQEMKNLMAVLNETLRVGTPISLIFPRIANSDHTLGELKIKKGTIVGVSLRALSLTTELEDTETFKPERFLGEEMKKLGLFRFIPFSAGPRNCIGQHLAMHEARIIITEFLRAFDYSFDANYQLQLIFKMFLEPKVPIQVTLKPNERTDMQTSFSLPKLLHHRLLIRFMQDS